MKQEEVQQLAARYVKQTTSPFDTDAHKNAVFAAFLSGFSVAAGMWQAFYLKEQASSKLKPDEKKPAAPLLVTSSKP